MKRPAFLTIALSLATALVACGPLVQGPGGGGADCSHPTPITSDSASGGVTLKKGCYDAADTVEVTGGTLTLEPGVTITFANNRGLRIDTDAALHAVGTKADPIVLKGEQDVSGAWMGVGFFDTKSADNDLEYLTIQNGGSDGWTGAGNSKGALAVYGNSLVKMVSGTITGSTTAGFIADGELDLSDTTVTKNQFPGWSLPIEATHIDGSNHLTGNQHDELRIEEDNAMAFDTTWHKLDVPYDVVAWIEVQSASTFTIDAGVTVKVDNGQRIAVDSQSMLVVNGTASDPVTITGHNDVPGDWQGITIGSPVNEMHYTTVSDGGSETNLDFAEILLDGGLSMDNVTVSKSSGWAISLRGGANLTGCPSVTFSQNAKGDIEGDVVNQTDCP